jgi:hypothetical protein
VHAFDTDSRDLERCGRLLQLREQSGTFVLVADRSAVAAEAAPASEAARLQIDSSWARQILSGTMSPIAALEQRLGRAAGVDAIRAAIADRPLARISSRTAECEPACHAEEPAAGAEAPALQSI